MSTVVSWSGGKDSCLSLWRAKQQLGLDVQLLLSVMDETGNRARSHGVSPLLLSAQAKSLNAEIIFHSTSWEEYESKFVSSLVRCKTERSIQNAVFGDIDIQVHREWEEKVCSLAGLTCILPLWQESRLSLVHEFLNAGFRAVVVCINGSYLPQEFCGREFDFRFLQDLPANVDPCGENGEFHTFVYDGPAFAFPVPFKRVEVQSYTSPLQFGPPVVYYFQILALED